jgi:hypothetical protein
VQASSLSELQDGLQEAIKAEDYAAAARIRDRISEFMQEDPVLQAEARLEAAIREERFEVRWTHLPEGQQDRMTLCLIPCHPVQCTISIACRNSASNLFLLLQDAAKLRDELKQLRPPSPVPAIAPALDLGATTAEDTTSNTFTDGIRVTCRSFYLPSESRAGTFFFGYQINIVNESQATVKLMERCVCPCICGKTCRACPARVPVRAGPPPFCLGCGRHELLTWLPSLACIFKMSFEFWR